MKGGGGRNVVDERLSAWLVLLGRRTHASGYER